MIYIKKLAIPLVCVLFILSLILFSKTAVEAANRGIQLWFNIVFPSLFPFFVASEILKATGFIRSAGIFLEPVMRPLFNVPGAGSFAFAMGITSGYPMGAKISKELLEEGLVNKSEAERLLAFSNNSGPLFIVGAVGTGMFGSPSIGVYLLVCHILACLTVGLLFRFYNRNQDRIRKAAYSNRQASANIRHASREGVVHRFRKSLLSPSNGLSNAGTLFGDAVRNALSLILAIGGFIILFSVIISLLLDSGLIGGLASFLSLFLNPLGIQKEIITAGLSGFFEITTGANLASKAASLITPQQLATASLIIGWAGLSVHSQVLSIISGSGIRLKPYLLGKLLQGVFAAFYTLAGLRFSWFSLPVWNPGGTEGRPPLYPAWLQSWSSSLAWLLCILIFFGGCALIGRRTGLLKKKHPGRMPGHD